MTSTLMIDALGWVGAVALLMAYGMVSRGRVTGRSVTYQVLNVIGSILLIINTLYYGAYPSTFVNVIWIGIAAYTLVRVRAKSSV